MSSCPFSFCISFSLPPFFGPLPFCSLCFFLIHLFFPLTFFFVFYSFSASTFFLSSFLCYCTSFLASFSFLAATFFSAFLIYSIRILLLPSTFYTEPSVLFQSPTLLCPSTPLGAHLYIKPPFCLMFSPYSSTLHQTLRLHFTKRFCECPTVL